MRRTSPSGRYAERVLEGVDDGGASERIVLWIDRREGGLWVVGRSINPQLRPGDGERPDDVVFSGFELDDALEHANDALEDDVSVLEQEGLDDRVRPFTRKEILPRLEREFFRS
jgi:hypothetical protein